MKQAEAGHARATHHRRPTIRRSAPAVHQGIRPCEPIRGTALAMLALAATTTVAGAWNRVVRTHWTARNADDLARARASDEPGHRVGRCGRFVVMTDKESRRPSLAGRARSIFDCSWLAPKSIPSSSNVRYRRMNFASAKKHNIEGRSGMTKDELIRALERSA